MANQDKSSNDILIQLLKDREKANRGDWIEDPTVGTGSAMYDFLGQAVWKAADELTLGTLGVTDVVREARAPGEDITTLEDTMAFGAGGNWDELSPAGKSGAIVGGALGMLPTLGLGKVIGTGLIKGGSKLFTGGTKTAIKTSTDDLIAAATKMPVK